MSDAAKPPPKTPEKKDAAAPASPAAPAVEGIPIGAKFKSPGPIYSLPPCIGTEAKYVGPRAPAFSLGVKLNSQRESIGPGPAAFSPRFLERSPSFSLQGGFKKTRRDGRAVIYGPNPHNAGEPSEVDLDNPGPAKYYVTSATLTKRRAPEHTITSRPRSDKLSMTPGPAAYNQPSVIGTRKITVPSSPAPTIGALRQSKSETKSPGPAAYQPVSPEKLSRTSPAYSLGRRWGNDGSLVYAKTIPGPGAYNPTPGVKASAPSYSFRRKHSEYEYFVQENTDDGPLIL